MIRLTAGLRLAALIAAVVTVACGVHSYTWAQATGEVVVLTTTTTQDSGILQHLVDEFGKSSGLRVKTIVASQSPAAAIGSASIAAGRCPVCIVGDPEKTASGRSTG